MTAIPISVTVCLATLAVSCRAQAVELVYADGRRVSAVAPQKNAKGEWTVEREGRRTVLHAGEIAAIVDAAGKETVIVPALVDTDPPAATKAALGDLRDPKNKVWEQFREQLSQHPNRSVHEALVALAGDRRKELRLRAITALTWLRTKESSLAAAEAVLAEKEPEVRRDTIGCLYSVEEILRRSDSAAVVAKGLADKDATVRIVFASLAPLDDPAATAVLRNDGLKHPDHHVREASAQDLGERGDGAGESILIGILSRSKPADLSDDAATNERLMTEGQARACAALGKIGTATARAALAKAAASRFPVVREAAAKALAPAR